MPVDPERLWSVGLVEPVQPRLVGPLQGSHEQLLPHFRGWTTRRLGLHVAGSMACALEQESPEDFLVASIRLVGIALWERETYHEADPYTSRLGEQS